MSARIGTGRGERSRRALVRMRCRVVPAGVVLNAAEALLRQENVYTVFVLEGSIGLILPEKDRMRFGPTLAEAVYEGRP